MFVDIKRWLLIYLYAGSGSFGHMPYLDTHGELDLSMRWVLLSSCQRRAFSTGPERHSSLHAIEERSLTRQTDAPAVHASWEDGRAPQGDLATTYHPALNGQKAGADFGRWRLGHVLILESYECIGGWWFLYLDGLHDCPIVTGLSVLVGLVVYG
jgi:hypothetical protein